MVDVLRRTQFERAAGTREALLSAAIECLVDVGYARTTTRMVAERAGVSRGAQTHHYPSKTDLVAAAIEHLFDRLIAQFRQAFATLPDGQRTLEEAVGLVWEVVKGPSFAAILEVTVAARTDPELRVVVHGMSAVLESSVVGLLRELFPAFGDDRLARTAIDVGFTLLEGAALNAYAGYGDPERTIRLVKNLAATVTPAASATWKGVMETP
jgi:AcrR family transcriptional regulator